MHKVIIRTIGGLQEGWQKEAIKMYQKRLPDLEVIELPEGHKGTAKPDLEKTKAAEMQSLLKGIPKTAWVVALDETGKESDSLHFSKKLKDWGENGRQIVFLIGGSWGLAEQIKDNVDFVLSLGELTLPHALARIILIEQLYRASTIQAGKTYHK